VYLIIEDKIRSVKRVEHQAKKKAYYVDFVSHKTQGKAPIAGAFHVWIYKGFLD